MIHNILYILNHVFYSIVTSGIIDTLGMTIEKKHAVQGLHEHIILSMSAALLLPGLRFEIQDDPSFFLNFEP